MTQQFGYPHATASDTQAHAMIAPAVLKQLSKVGARRVVDLGCGTGSLCRDLAKSGLDVVGFDSSESGVQLARAHHHTLRFEQIDMNESAPPDLLGTFDAIVCTEVVEHLYAPRSLPAMALQLLRPGGVALVTTPYHGYLKNLALSFAGGWDRHHTALWDHGHIKFWSRDTLVELFQEQRFEFRSFEGLGRAPWLWKSMLVTFTAPE